MIDSTNLKYFFNEVYPEALDPSTLRRIKIKGDTVRCFISDDSGKYDIFNLYDSSSQNSIMINKLYDYRMGNVVDLSDLDYDDINYTLAKLIYGYLDMMINGTLRDLDTTSCISTEDSLIDSMFETYVLNEIYKLIKTYSISLNSNLIETIPVRLKYIIDSTNILDDGFTITELLPYSTERVYLFKNGETLDSTNYDLSLDSSSFTIEMDNSSIFDENDILLIDYYRQIDIT